MVFGLKRNESLSDTSDRSTSSCILDRNMNAVSSPANPPPTITTLGLAFIDSPLDGFGSSRSRGRSANLQLPESRMSEPFPLHRTVRASSHPKHPARHL